MKHDFLALAELKEGERPYKSYFISLERGYIRLMASRLDKEGMVVAINYYGKTDKDGKVVELNRVNEKRQTVKEFEDDLARFKKMLEQSGLQIFIDEIK